MAGKTPLLLAMVLFAIGASGLALTSAERSSWGPFQPRGQATPEQRVVIVDVSAPVAIPSLEELFTSRPARSIESSSAAVSSAPAPEAAEPSPTPIAPLRVYGISADDGGVAAASVSETPPPLRIVNVASDDAPAAEPPAADETPQASETPAASETPESSATPSPEASATPQATGTPSPEAGETPQGD